MSPNSDRACRQGSSGFDCACAKGASAMPAMVRNAGVAAAKAPPCRSCRRVMAKERFLLDYCAIGDAIYGKDSTADVAFSSCWHAILRRNAPITNLRGESCKRQRPGEPGRCRAFLRAGCDPAQAPGRTHHFAAVGSGAGCSDSELRYAITSARSLSFGIPAKPMAVPGTKPLGLAMNWLRSSIVQSPPLAFIAAEKLNPLRPSPLWSPTMP